MPMLNPDFSLPGPLEGEAAGWSLQTFVASKRYAGFEPFPHRPVEDFERWAPFTHQWIPGAIQYAPLGLEGQVAEDHETGWHNHPFHTAFGPSNLVAAPVEVMETGWGNDDYASSWDQLNTAAALFLGDPAEPFEAGWRSNESYLWAWGSVTEASALFDDSTIDTEGFEGTWDLIATM